MHILTAFRALSDLVSRSKLAGLLGNGHGGKRDYYEVFGYKKTLLYQDLLLRYMRQGIAARVVEAPAQALWDTPPQVVSNDAEWNEAWNRLITKNNLWEALYKVDKLCGLGRYAVLFIGTNGTWNPEKPATKSTELRKVLYLQAYSQNTAEISSLEGDPTSEQYMRPQIYTMYPYKQDEESIPVNNSGLGLTSFKAHYSRILHVAENTLENSILGYPRLERVYNDLEDMLKVSGGTAETYWLTSNRGMQVDVDKDMDLSTEDAADLSDEIEEYQHQLRRFIRTRGVKIENLGADVPHPKETFDMLISLISGATGIPRRILIGAEAGQLASEQDRANWADRIKSRRTNFGEPVVIYPLIRRLTDLQVLPKKKNLEITIVWPDAYSLSPLEEAQKSAQHARSVTNFARAIKDMETMKRGKPAVPPQKDAEGNDIPGTGSPEEPPLISEDLIKVEEARRFIGLDKPTPQLNDPEDV